MIMEGKMTDLTNALGEIEDALKEFQDMAYEHTHEGNHIQAGQALKLCAAIREAVPFMTPTPDDWKGDIRSVCDLPSAYRAAAILSTICKESK